MTELYRFDLEGGGSVVVEAEPDPGVVRASRATAVIREATQSFESALVGARDAASAALKQFTSMVHQPTAVEITFGVYLDAKAGAIIAQAGAQGHFEVKLKWERKAEQDA